MRYDASLKTLTLKPFMSTTEHTEYTEIQLIFSVPFRVFRGKKRILRNIRLSSANQTISRSYFS